MKAIFNNPDAGSNLCVERAGKLLVVGQSYEITEVDQYSWYTDVYLKGFDESFNSVMFEYDDKDEFDRLCSVSFKRNYRLD